VSDQPLHGDVVGALETLAREVASAVEEARGGRLNRASAAFGRAEFALREARLVLRRGLRRADPQRYRHGELEKQAETLARARERTGT
jgi:hypothetical protein